MLPLLVLLLLLLLFGGLGFAAHALWIVLAVLLVVWLFGYVGPGGGSWYRW